MKSPKTFLASLVLITLIGIATNASAQCSVTAVPSFSSSCLNEYYSTISASGITVVSTISLTGGSCSGTYSNYYASQGITVTAGNTVNLNITRFTTTYTGYLSVYVDWNNDGVYSPSELSGTMLTMPSSLRTVVYSFPVPAVTFVPGVHLHMRIFLNELATGAPCTGNFGQAFDYYLQANCPATTTSVTVAPPSGSICSGGAGISFTATGTGSGISYSWVPAAGLSASTGATVVATPTVTTVYTVTETAALGCISFPGTATVTVNPFASAAVTASGPLATCDSVIFTTDSTPGDTYQWYNGTTPIAGATDTAYKATTPGSYQLKVSNLFGCTDTSSVFTVTVHAPVPVSITHTRPNKFCYGDSVKLKATSGTGYAYQWFRSGMLISGATDSSYTADTSGYYTCNIIIPGVCTMSTASDTVTSSPLIPVVTFDGKTFRTASYYRTYQWYKNNVAITGATHDSTIAHSNGNYTVKVTDTSGCTGTSLVYDLTNIAVPSITASGAITIYPNPANNFIYIDAPEPVNVVISGMEGKTIAKQTAVTSMNVSDLPSGIYVIELFDSKGYRLLVQKLVKN